MNAQRRPGAVADRVVDLRDGRDVVVDEPERLAPERLEQAVGDEAVDLACARRSGCMPTERYDGGGALDRLGRGLRRRRRPRPAAAGRRG